MGGKPTQEGGKLTFKSRDGIVAWNEKWRKWTDDAIARDPQFTDFFEKDFKKWAIVNEDTIDLVAGKEVTVEIPIWEQGGGVSYVIHCDDFNGRFYAPYFVDDGYCDSEDKDEK